MQVAIIGTGFMGVTHVEALRRLGVGIAGILGSTEAKSVEAARELGISRAYKDFDDVLSDVTADAVHICVPNAFHYAYAKAALIAGKHVMCEKPLAMDSKQSAELVEVAKDKSLAAGVCYNLRYYPLNLQAKAMVAGGELGRLFHINGCYIQDWLLHESDYNWRLHADIGGPLRVVADIGTHWMDMLSTITGLEIEAVFADMSTVYPTRKRPAGGGATFTKAGDASGEDVTIDTEDYASILLRFKGGVKASLYVSQVAAGQKNALRYEIYGAQKSVAWDGQRPNELWVGERDKANNILIKDPSLMAPGAAAAASYPGGHAEGYPDTFKQCFRAFYDYIKAGDYAAAPTFPTFAAGHREIQLCEAILESHRQERWVTV
ncbi:Gfo/Idh/MocA family protein [Kordiimonas sp.]|uniref:Gfo/Idh/MocA family protein n=1 Tax=Kordiimonas sp. TaxID=1970157 RepID=UPI003A902BA9